MSPRERLRAAGLMAGAILAAGACGGEAATAPRPAPGVHVVSGPAASDTVLAAPAGPLVIEVRGMNSALATGVVVRFAGPAVDSLHPRPALYVCAPATPACTSTDTTVTTDANGRATVAVRFGTVAGPPSVIVTAPEVAVRDSVPFTVLPGQAAGVKVTAPAPSVTIGMAATFRASVVDQFGNARPGNVTLSYAGTSGAAAFDPATGTLTGQDFGEGYVYARAGALVDSAAVRVLPSGRLVGWDPGTNGVSLVNLDGSAVRPVVTGVSSFYGVYPRFSPSGGALVMQIGTGYMLFPDHVVTVDTTGANRRDVDLSRSDAYFSSPATQPRLMGDGSVLFVRRTRAGPHEYLYASYLARLLPDGTLAPAPLQYLRQSQASYGVSDIAPDGSKVAYAGTEFDLLAYPYYGGGPTMRVLTVATGDTVVVDAKEGQAPRWSADGRRLAYLTGFCRYEGCPAPGQLVLVNADGSGRTVLASAGSFAGDGGLAWSPDGAYLLGTDATSRMPRLVRLRDGASILLPLGQSSAGFLQPDWR